NLKCGIRYRLTEIAAPEGFHKLEEYIYLTINEDGSVSVEDESYAGAGSTAYNIFVINSEAVPLPEAGGTGNSMFYVAGLLLLMAAAYIHIRTRRKKGVGT
ncbi:MAG: LPXTG cell wall anchor domain-containing protein, partial [Firmicutes bacterium]|nr:LPXTG cell wall anchor domain-containing protein [Bacillota bacterium]